MKDFFIWLFVLVVSVTVASGCLLIGNGLVVEGNMIVGNTLRAIGGGAIICAFGTLLYGIAVTS